MSKTTHFDDDYGPSKTQRKQAVREQETLTDELLRVGVEEIEHLPVEAALRAALREYHRTRGFEARRRQAQYVTKLLRLEETSQLQRVLSQRKQGPLMSAAESRLVQDAEQWCTRLINADSELTDWMNRYPATPVQTLRKHLRAVRKALQVPAADSTSPTAMPPDSEKLDAEKPPAPPRAPHPPATARSVERRALLQLLIEQLRTSSTAPIEPDADAPTSDPA